MENRRITVYVGQVAESSVKHLEFVVQSAPPNTTVFVDSDGNPVATPRFLPITPDPRVETTRLVRIAHANTEEAARAKKASFTLSVVLPNGNEAPIEQLTFTVHMQSPWEKAAGEFSRGVWGHTSPVFGIMVTLMTLAVSQFKKTKEKTDKLILVKWLAQAIVQIDDRNWTGALSTLESIYDIDPGYNEVGQLKTQVRRAVQISSRVEGIEQEQELELLHQVIVDDYKRDTGRRPLQVQKEIAEKQKEYEASLRRLRQTATILGSLLMVGVIAIILPFWLLWQQPSVPIRIGLQGPFTGQYADHGQGFQKAVTLLADQINEKGGLLDGHKIEIVALDDANDLHGPVTSANELVGRDVVAVIGSYESSATEEAAGIYDEAGILQITPSATAPQLTTKGYDKFFRLAFPADRQALFAATFVVDRLGAREAAVIYDNSAYAEALANWPETYLKEQGADVVAIETIDLNLTSFEPILTKMKSIDPDIIYFAGERPPIGILLEQSSDLGLESRWLMVVDVSDPHVMSAKPDLVADAYFVTDPLIKYLDNQKSEDFFEEFATKYGEKPADISWARASDALQLIVDAIEATESISGEVLAEYIQQVRDFPGVSGTIVGFDEHGDRQGADYGIYTVDEKGNLVPPQLPQ